MSDPDIKQTTGTIAQIRAAYERGEGGYRTLAKRFGIRPQTVQGYLKRDAAYGRCSRKLRFASPEEAIRAIHTLPEEGRSSLSVYACENCGKFHFGHPQGISA